jgi:hypothetical protein
MRIETQSGTKGAMFQLPELRWFPLVADQAQDMLKPKATRGAVIVGAALSIDQMKDTPLETSRLSSLLLPWAYHLCRICGVEARRPRA